MTQPEVHSRLALRFGSGAGADGWLNDAVAVWVVGELSQRPISYRVYVVA